MFDRFTRGARACAVLFALPAAAIALSQPAQAQTEPPENYPSRNILLVVPFAAGGPPDVIARVLAPSMSETLGRTIIVENRPGASTTMGTLAVTRAAPDGYTLLASSLSMVVVPYVLAKPGFDPLVDLKPISTTGSSPQTLVVDQALPIRTAAELVAFARRNPTDIKAAHTGIGTSTHLGLLALMQAGNFSTLPVPYRGASQAISDIVAGHISLLMTAPSTSIQLARDGKVRLLGLTGTKRMSAMPELPTLKEQGLDLSSLDAGVWFGLSAPAGTPDPIVSKLNAATRKALEDKTVTETLARNDTTTFASTPQEFDKLIRDQIVVWREVMRKAGIKPE
jgi:tripartite-type tricarboxylate transporter receptor subunit TctC